MKRFTAQFLMIIILINLGLVTVFAQTEPKKLREVTIYLLREIADDEEYDPNNPLWLFPVKRQVESKNSLAAALRSLTKGATREEARRKYHSSTFGIRFVSVSLKNGKLVAHFASTPSVNFSGDNGPFIFQEAVRKTAVQFKEVEKVVVCLNGEADFGGEDDRPSKKC